MAVVGCTQTVVVESTVIVNSSVTVSITMARLASGVAATMARKDERATMLAVFISSMRALVNPRMEVFLR